MKNQFERVKLGVNAISAFFFLLFALATPTLVHAFDQQHQQWNQLLEKHVHWFQDGQASQVNYQGFLADQKMLQSYLDQLSAVQEPEFREWNKQEQLAFLINVYNAYTIQLILNNWPVSSIRDIGHFFSGPWSQPFIPLFGEMYTLDDIEHEMIRAPGVYDDERIHFAVNCASVGCPALRPEAYLGSTLSRQLDDNQRRFLQDASRNQVDCRSGEAEVSPIFDWYEEDFERAAGSVSRWLIKNVCPELDPGEKQLDIDHTSYDWALNGVNGSD